VTVETPVTETLTIEAPPAPKKKSARLPFLDWSRGLAATIMLQGHVFHSFARPELRESGPYVISQFIGGIAPAIFLFLTGITFAFLMHGMERRAASPKDRVITAMRRAGYLGLLAFRFESSYSCSARLIALRLTCLRWTSSTAWRSPLFRWRDLLY